MHWTKTMNASARPPFALVWRSASESAGTPVAMLITSFLLLSGILVSDLARASNRLDAEEAIHQTEVHAIGIYEGFVKTGDQIHGPKAMVTVDRPGRKVILVLTSHSGAIWNLQVTPGTQIQQIILGGRRLQKVVGAPDEARITEAWQGIADNAVPYTHRNEGQRFRQFCETVHSITNTELSSFHGVYRAEAGTPIVIDRVQEQPELKHDFPQPVEEEALPADAAQLRFDALDVQHGNDRFERAVSFGAFDIRGPVGAEHWKLPKRVHRVAFDSDHGVYYAIQGHRMVRIDPKSSQVTPIDTGLEVPGISWPTDLTYDAKRQRVVLVTLGGTGYVYAYSPKDGQWSVLADCENKDYHAIAYAPKEDAFYGLIFEYNPAGSLPVLVRMDSQGKVTRRISLGEPIGPGSIAEHAAGTTQLAVAGKYLVILTGPGHISGNGEGLNAKYMYLVNPIDGRVWLTSREAVGQ